MVIDLLNQCSKVSMSHPVQSHAVADASTGLLRKSQEDERSPFSVCSNLKYTTRPRRLHDRHWVGKRSNKFITIFFILQFLLDKKISSFPLRDDVCALASHTCVGFLIF